MKVHRIITTIEVENDDHSITSVELTNLLHTITNPIAITDVTTNGNANDMNQVYTVINAYRFNISNKLKSIAILVNDGLDNYKCGIIGRDKPND